MSKYNVFYSWQTEIPITDNKKPIQLSLTDACQEIAKKYADFDYILDESTRDTPGSPNIPETIFSKISLSDIFVADITTTNNLSDAATRRNCNSNVLIELGFAIAILGWERIILLFNKQYGTFPDDIAFDIDRYRILDFKITNKDDKSGMGQLAKELANNIETIFNKKPLKALEKLSLEPEQKKKLNDINTITEFCKSIDIIAIEEFIKEFDTRFNGEIFFFYEDFKAKFESSYFYLYDEDIKVKFECYLNLWSQSFSFYRYYRATKGYNFIFTTENIRTSDDYKILEEIRKTQIELMKSFKDLLGTIRKNWVEVDLNNCSRCAREKYIDFYKSILGTS